MTVTISGVSVQGIFAAIEEEQEPFSALGRDQFRQNLLSRTPEDHSGFTAAQLDALFAMIDLDESGSVDAAEVGRAISILMDASGRPAGDTDFGIEDYAALPPWLPGLHAIRLMGVSLYALLQASGDSSNSGGYFSLSRTELESALDSLPLVDGQHWLDRQNIRGFVMDRKDILDFVLSLFDTDADSALSANESTKAFDELYKRSINVTRDDNGNPVAVVPNFGTGGSQAGNVTQAGIENYLQYALGRFIETFVRSVVQRTEDSFKEMDKVLRRN